MFHCIAGDERSSPTQPGFAVNGKNLILFLSDLQKFVYDFFTWACSISEKEFIVIYVVANEILPIISCSI